MAADPISRALNALKISQQQWLEDRQGRIRITAFNVLHCRNPQVAGAVIGPPPKVSGVTRPAFRAGSFYPSDPGLAQAEVDTHLRAGGVGKTATEVYRAIMLPHAGWLFCGGTMGKTLAGVKLPRTLIILGPRHTALGANNSVANHNAWQIPGATIPVDTAIAQRLSRAVPGLAYESEAHRQEHGTEVILPFLHRLRPDLQIVPIVLGQCDGPFLTTLAGELISIIREARSRGEEPPLLVISSDMNHFAAEPENRRRDMLAINAMLTGDPRRLFDTCTSNDISMCGLIPAVAVMQALQIETPTLQPRLVDYSNSAAASGDTSRVVGYAGVVIP
jgi:AmmeMemoRadiSam system protein B